MPKPRIVIKLDGEDRLLADEVMSYCDFYKQDKDTYKSKYAKER